MGITRRMATKGELVQQLGVVAGFTDPTVELEQYRTPPELAAHLVHTADLQGDIERQRVLDFGCGTGMLALAAALRGPAAVVGVDIDPGPLSIARENEQRVGTTVPVDWVLGDVTRSGLCPADQTTVLTNPPFGAQTDNEHADRRFLKTTAAVADISYSVHNAGSREFVEAFAGDEGGTVTRAYAAEFDLPRSFDFHRQDRRTIDGEVLRIAWS